MDVSTTSTDGELICVRILSMTYSSRVSSQTGCDDEQCGAGDHRDLAILVDLGAGPCCMIV
jgi:hypothetical protein